MCFLGRHSRWTGIVVAGLTLLGGAVTAPAVAAPAVAGPAVAAAALAPAAPRVSAAPLGADAQWSAPAPLPAGTAAGLASSARPSVLDCAGTGSCSALGSADDPSSAYGDSEAFVDNQVDGSWLRPRLLPGLAALDTGFPASVLTLSCSTAGDCAAGGFYAHPRSSDFDLRQGFIVTEKNGSWGSAENVPGLSALNTADYAAVSSISCTAPGYCTAAGFYTIGVPLGAEDGGTFTVQEVAGTWQQARPVPGLSGLATSGESVACAAPGDCTVVGSNEAAKQTFTLREIGSRWGAVQTIKKMTSIYPPSLSCSGSGDCAVASGNQVASSTGGVWSAAATVGGSGLDLGALSCGSPGDCLAGGYNQAGVLSNPYAVTIGQHAGTWGAVSAVPGINAVSHGGDSNVSAISCAAAASCQVGGGYVVNPTSIAPSAGGFVDAMNDNNTLPPQTFPQGNVGVISCAAAGCGALVAPTLNATTISYSDFSQKLLSTSTDLTLSAARATYGHEQSEKLAVSVAPSPDGPAGGTVTITAGKTVLCTITLTSAKGRCALSARQLKAGAYRLVASYLGDKRYRPSVSPGRELTVVQSGFDVVTMRRAVGAAAGPLTRHRRQSRGH